MRKLGIALLTFIIGGFATFVLGCAYVSGALLAVLITCAGILFFFLAIGASLALIESGS